MHYGCARIPKKLRAWESSSHIECAAKREKNPAGGSIPPKPNP